MENKCVGCDTPIPQGASKCPMCGAPVQMHKMQATPAYSQQQTPIVQTVTEVHHHHHPGQPDKPVLIEQTAKKWKKLYLWAWLFFFMGFVSCVGAAGGEPSMATPMGVFFLIGFVLYVRARTGAWWNHG